MNNITPKEAIANLNHIYGMVSPDMQRSLDVAIKCMEERPQGDLISREALIREIGRTDEWYKGCSICDTIDNAPTVPQVTVFTETADEKAIADLKAELQSVIEPRPKGEWTAKEETPASVSYYCSVCKAEGIPITPFCPWCGASMKGDAE